MINQNRPAGIRAIVREVSRQPVKKMRLENNTPAPRHDPTSGVVISDLTIDITQRCNLACSHCLRGDARDVDISHKVIDAMLDQLSEIGTLGISGGEPTLAPDAFGYLIDGIIKRNIMVMRTQVITNGTIRSKPFAKSMKRLMDYMHERQNLEDIEDICHIIISQDKYHDVTHDKRNGTQLFYLGYGIPTDMQPYQKKDWLAMGRAKDGLKGTNTYRINRLHRIDTSIRGGELVIGGGESTLCLELVPDGSLILDGGIENDYPEQHPEGIICNVLDGSIIDAIQEWNEKYPNELTEDDITEFTI